MKCVGVGALAFACVSVVNVSVASQAHAADASAGIETVTVSAERRSEDAMKVPLSITALSGDKLKTFGVHSNEELANYTPGLSMNHGLNNTSLFIRGIGFFSGTPGNEPGVAFYVDGVYFPSVITTNHTFNLDIDHVEILKGPQGTLYGRNAAGGVIQIITKDPQQEPRFDLEVGYANYNTVSASFYGSVGLTDDLAADVSVHYDDQMEGWGRNLVSGDSTYLSNEFSARTKWVWTPGDVTKVTFIANYSTARNDQGAEYSITPGTETNGGHFASGGFYDTITSVTPFGPSFGKTKTDGLSLKIEHDFGWAHAVSLTAWNEGTGTLNLDNDAQPEVFGGAFIDQRAATYTQEFQLLSDESSSIKWVAGLFLFWDKEGVDPFISIPSLAHIFANQTVTSWAPYGEATIPIWSDTRFTGGIRYTFDHKVEHAMTFSSAGVLLSTTNPAAQDTGKVTYKASLDHDFAPGVLGYISYSTGFRSGNFNNLNPAATPTKPQTIEAYEAGVKSTHWDGRLTLEFAVFDYVMKNIVVQTLGNSSTVIQTNAAAGESKGVDFNIVVAPLDDLTIGFGGSILDAKFTNFKNAINYAPCVTPASAPSCATYAPGGGYFTFAYDATENALPYTEKYNLTLTGQYNVSAFGGDLQFSEALAFHSGQFFDSNEANRQTAYINWDSTVKWTAPGANWDLSLWAKNITDNHTWASNTQAVFGHLYTADAPRTFGVRIGYHYN
ncbi:MAG: TonB-dependent receptor [Rhizomicrobium sp.]